MSHSLAVWFQVTQLLWIFVFSSVKWQRGQPLKSFLVPGNQGVKWVSIPFSLCKEILLREISLIHQGTLPRSGEEQNVLSSWALVHTTGTEARTQINNTECWEPCQASVNWVSQSDTLGYIAKHQNDNWKQKRALCWPLAVDSLSAAQARRELHLCFIQCALHLQGLPAPPPAPHPSWTRSSHVTQSLAGRAEKGKRQEDGGALGQKPPPYLLRMTRSTWWSLRIPSRTARPNPAGPQTGRPSLRGSTREHPPDTVPHNRHAGMPAWALHIRQQASQPPTERKTAAPGTSRFAPGSPHRRWPCRPTRIRGWTCSRQANKRIGWEAPGGGARGLRSPASHLSPGPALSRNGLRALLPCPAMGALV